MGQESRKALEASVAKVSGDVVFGFAIVSEILKGDSFSEYVDLQGDWIPEDVMLEASKDFMSGDRKALAMHQGEQVGKVLFALPFTHDIAKGLGISSYDKTGLIIGMKPSEEVLSKFASGEYTGFSLGGLIDREEMDDA